MENSYRFFKNTACRYYPCHEGIGELNCLFCFCPFYGRKNCPGRPRFIKREAGSIKDCSGCTFPHRAENYDAIMSLLKETKYEE